VHERLEQGHGTSERIPEHLLDLRRQLGLLLLPERRSERRYPRVIKIKMSNYDKKWVKRPRPN